MSRFEQFAAETMGRPGLPPDIYFRLLLIGYFEGIDSERGVAHSGFADGARLDRQADHILDLTSTTQPPRSA